MQFLLKSHMSYVLRHTELRPCDINVLFRKTNCMHVIIYFYEHDLKLRKQAATELKDLKAELVQKRNQSSGTTASLGLGTNLWDKP